MVTSIRHGYVPPIDDMDAVKTSPTKHIFRTVGTVLALVRDKMTGDKNPVRSRLNVREMVRTTLRRKNVGDVNEPPVIPIQDSDRAALGIEQTLGRGANASHIEEDQWKVEEHTSEVQEIPAFSRPGTGPHYQINDYSGVPNRTNASTTISLGRSDLQTLDSYQLSMGGSTSAHLMGPNVAFPQPLSRPHARPARSHVMFHQPSGLHMHPLFAYSRLHHAPIQYDVCRTPSARTVLDCTTHSPVPAHALAQPATDPPIGGLDQLLLKSHKFPWTIIVKADRVSLPRGRRSHSNSVVGGIRNLDVLYAIHTTLLARVTPEEWIALSDGSKAQRKVTRAYEGRCSVTGDWEGGVRRVDWLGGKTHLVGIEVDRSNGDRHGKLVFARLA